MEFVKLTYGEFWHQVVYWNATQERHLNALVLRKYLLSAWYYLAILNWDRTYCSCLMCLIE